MAKVNCLDVGKSHVILGDCVNMMKRIPTDTVDCIITALLRFFQSCFSVIQSFILPLQRFFKTMREV